MNKQTLLLFASLPLLAQSAAKQPNTEPQHLIAFLGDSFAAGEGAPSNTGDKWVNEPCHLSQENGRHRAAEILGALVPARRVFTSSGFKTVDDFQVKDVACTGATITEGILGPYAGINRMRPAGPGPNSIQPPQIDQIESWMKASPRNRDSVDTVVISIGGNDVGFAKIISECMNPLAGDCNDSDYLQSMMNNGNFYMPHLIGYNRLRQAFIDMDAKIREKLKPSRIILVGYPNGLRDEYGNLCDEFNENFHILPDGDGFKPSSFGGATVHVKAPESSFIETELIARINTERKSIAANLGWQFIDIQPFTRNHGFCSNKPWFNTPKTTWRDQEDFNGTAHPNATGYKVYQNFLVRELARAHGIRLTSPVTGHHEQFSFQLAKRGGGQFIGDFSDRFSGFPYTVLHHRNFVAHAKFLLDPNPSRFTEIRLEVSSTDFAFNPPASDIRVITPAGGLVQDGMIRADFNTAQYDDNDLLFIRWRFKHVPFWDPAAAPVVSYSTVAKYRVHGILPLIPAND
ncbi:MAG: hypothetical protein JNM66_01830 [Bryobacterales bacterium]|nr:hypothetical protein [Bryobacterales bacterium]